MEDRLDNYYLIKAYPCPAELTFRTYNLSFAKAKKLIASCEAYTIFDSADEGV